MVHMNMYNTHEPSSFFKESWGKGDRAGGGVNSSIKNNHKVMESYEKCFGNFCIFSEEQWLI